MNKGIQIGDKNLATLLYADEFCNFSKTQKLLSESAIQVLRKVIGTFKGMPNMAYNTFSKLYNAFDDTILNYGVGVQVAYSNGQISEKKTQNVAARACLGIHKYSANQAINGDMG